MLISPPPREIRNWHCDSRLWANFKPRADDIIIGTSVKCGTTWMQQIVCLLVFQSAEPQPITGMSPWFDARFLPVSEERKLAALEQQTHRRFIKTHLPWDALPIYDTVKYIHVARDGRDACMSWHHHRMIQNLQVVEKLDAAGVGDPLVARPMPRAKADAREFFLDWMHDAPFPDWRDSWPAAHYFDIERSYWAARREPNLLMVHFNDLKRDLDGEMRRVSEFLGIAVDESVWPNLVHAATFGAMKSHSAELGRTYEFAFAGGLGGFLHEGTNARWRGVLTLQDISDYESRVKRETSPALARWLEGGRTKSGDPRTSEN